MLALTLVVSPAVMRAQTQNPVPPELATLDHATAQRAGARGLDAALAPVLSPEAVLLWPGAPVVRGRTAILALLAAQPERFKHIMWDAVAAQLSNDGGLAVTYGTTTTLPSAGDSAHRGRFIGAWRRSGAGGWELLGLCLGGWPSNEDYIAPAVRLEPLPALARENSYARVDYDFAGLALRAGVGVAYETYAAADAIAAGTRVQPYIRGPANIRRAFEGAGANRATWSWWPVYAAGDSTGAIGLTVGEGEIGGTNSAGQPHVDHTKYMTLWRREADGTIRFIADGGSLRPAPRVPE
jgi:ketosteroid isomerase-like protein